MFTKLYFKFFIETIYFYNNQSKDDSLHVQSLYKTKYIVIFFNLSNI